MTTLEEQILHSAANAIEKAIMDELVGYNKPLSNLTNKVLEAHESELYDLINVAFVDLIGGQEFKDALKQALNKKLATSLINRMGGELEKQVNKLKSNPETRAKITLAISQIITDLSTKV